MKNVEIKITYTMLIPVNKEDLNRLGAADYLAAVEKAVMREQLWHLDTYPSDAEIEGRLID